MPDEEKHEDNLHELDREPASGTLNDRDDSEHRINVFWGGKSSSEPDESESPDSSVSHDEDKLRDEKHEANSFQKDSSKKPEPVEVPATTKTSTQPVALVVSDELPKPGPGLLVLQWLSYAFWGWTVLSLSGLVVTVVSQLLNQGNDYGDSGIAYLLAAVIVLFIISLVTDIFYANAEKKHARTSGTNVIMIIHAVIFALFGIGALIVSVFGLVSLLINDTSSSTGPLTTIISGGIIAVLYGLTLLRTLRPRWIKAVVPIYWIILTIAVLVSVTLGIVGPAAQAKLQNEDTAVESGLPRLADAVNLYATNHTKLPNSLSDLTDVPTSAQKLIDENKVTYKPGEKLAPNVKILGTTGTSSSTSSQTPIFHYELCVDYKAKDSVGDSYNPSTNGQRYPTSIYTYGHKAGHVCYDVQTDYLYD